MCLKYGTPYRLTQSYYHGASFPEECHHKDDLLAILADERAQDVYHDETLYHPLLRSMLYGLVDHHARTAALWQEPRHMFCDKIQAVALIFGFHDNIRTMPKRLVQDNFGYLARDTLHPEVYLESRNVAMCCVEEAARLPYQRLLDDWNTLAGLTGALIVTSLRQGWIDGVPAETLP